MLLGGQVLFSEEWGKYTFYTYHCKWFLEKPGDLEGGKMLQAFGSPSLCVQPGRNFVKCYEWHIKILRPKVKSIFSNNNYEWRTSNESFYEWHYQRHLRMSTI